MTRMSVVLSWSTYPDLKSCQRNLVNWVASMKKGVTLKQTETNDFALVSSQTNFRVAVETSWKAGRISFWQQLVRLASPISPFHGFSLPEVPSTFAAACVRVSQKTGDCTIRSNDLKCVFTFIHLCIPMLSFACTYAKCTRLEHVSDSDNWLDIQ